MSQLGAETVWSPLSDVDLRTLKITAHFKDDTANGANGISPTVVPFTLPPQSDAVASAYRQVRTTHN